MAGSGATATSSALGGGLGQLAARAPYAIAAVAVLLADNVSSAVLLVLSPLRRMRDLPDRPVPLPDVAAAAAHT